MIEQEGDEARNTRRTMPVFPSPAEAPLIVWIVDVELIEQPRHTRIAHPIRQPQVMLVPHPWIIHPRIRPIRMSNAVMPVRIRKRKRRLDTRLPKPLQPQNPIQRRHRIPALAHRPAAPDIPLVRREHRGVGRGVRGEGLAGEDVLAELVAGERDGHVGGPVREDVGGAVRVGAAEVVFPARGVAAAHDDELADFGGDERRAGEGAGGVCGGLEEGGEVGEEADGDDVEAGIFGGAQEAPVEVDGVRGSGSVVDGSRPVVGDFAGEFAIPAGLSGFWDEDERRGWWTDLNL